MNLERLSRDEPSRLLRLTKLFSLMAATCCVLVIFCETAAVTADQPTLTDQHATIAPAAAEPSSPAAWYGEGVRPTEPRSPQEQLAGFHVPDGFEVRLFAAEPQIAKPMNLAFDHRGRLWVTDSFEYPFPAADPSKARDSIRILEDLDQDGTADRATVFDDGLNIPIGVLPYGDGCICFSIPNIYYLRDTNGDGRCDQREVILGPFDTTRDTHGMVNAMRLGPDGWVYANHGFNNQSTVKGRDGHAITMHSGNTFRFLPDGSRVELVTSGQVNPFGRATDDWGYDYTADCHSKPISQLIRGGCYPSFGRPHDGLGFVPPMMDHLHGSTAISGLAYIPRGVGLDPLAGQMLSGNVMTSRLNRNQVVYQGATARAEALGDFLTSDDPWFRPVDIRLGPDGFIYVADFYNRIIGHYEVPLDHPGRDRYRGRIWQIRHTQNADAVKHPIFALLEQAGLPVDWCSPNPTRRELALQLAVQQASPQLDQAAQQFLTACLKQTASSTDASDLPPQIHAIVSATAYLAQRQSLHNELANGLVGHSSPIVRVHTFRLLAGTKSSTNLDKHDRMKLALPGLSDKHSHVRQAAAELAGLLSLQSPQATAESLTAINRLLRSLATLDDSDPILRQSLRIAIRDSLPRDRNFQLEDLVELDMTSQETAELADIMLAVEGTTAGTFLLAVLSQESKQQAVRERDEWLVHMVRNLPADRLPEGIQFVRRVTSGDRNRELAMLSLAFDAALATRSDRSNELRAWAAELSSLELADAKSAISKREPLTVAWDAGTVPHWPKQPRQSAENRQISVNSSILLGETYTGTYGTSPFISPDRIEFWLAGHNGMPDQVDHQKNRVQLVEVSTGEILRTAYPPRNDVAIKVVWDGEDLQGRLVRIQCIDRDNGSAYAWLAIGEFQPRWLEPSADATPVDRVLNLVERFKLQDQRSGLIGLISLLDHEPARQATVAAAVARLDDRPVLATLLVGIAELLPGASVQKQLIDAVAHNSSFDPIEVADQISRLLAAKNQMRFAELLSNNLQQLEVLVELVERGSLSASVLLDKNLWDKALAVGGERLLQTASRLRDTAQPVTEQVQQQLVEIAAMVNDVRYDQDAAQALFGKHCSNCHQLNGKGQVVGPQLDGIGARGVSRLAEDILVPDRNVDVAFRTTTFLTESGNVLSGLVRDENDRRVLLIGQDGKETELPTEQIEQRKVGANSLMPSNFHELMTREELASVIRYLTETAVQK